MDKCSCLNPDSIAGVLKTVYLFLEGQNFRQTCDTFLNESQVMGYAEFKKAIARILVLKPSVTEVVKVSHADPVKNEHQIQADLPIFMDAAVRKSPSKDVCVYYGEPLCIDHPECSLSSPQLAAGICPCKAQSECKKGGINIVETRDNTHNDMETERILKKAVRDEVRVAPPPQQDTDSIHSKKDKKINFKQPVKVYVRPEKTAPAGERSHLPESISRSFPKDFSLHRSDVNESEMSVAVPREENIIDKKPSRHAPPEKSESKVVAKSVSKLEKPNEMLDEEVLLRTENLKDVPSLATVKSKTSTASVRNQKSAHSEDVRATPSTASVRNQRSAHSEDVRAAPSTASVRNQRSTHSEDVRAAPSTASVKNVQSMHHKGSTKSDMHAAQRPSSTSVRFDINGRVMDPTNSNTDEQAVDVKSKSNLNMAEESKSSIHPPPSGMVIQSSHVKSQVSTHSVTNAQHSAASLGVSKDLETDPSTASILPASHISLQTDKSSTKTSDVNLAGSRDLDICPSTGTVCPASRTSLLPAAPSRKSMASERMSVGSTKPSMKSVAPLGSARSRYVEEGAINIASCLPRSAPVQSHSMATSTNAMKCVESSTEGVRTICKSISCTPNLVERSASTRSLRESTGLDYNKVRKELRSGCPSVRIILLQALRWRITRATDDGNRNDIVSNYARHDLLSLHGTPSGSHKSIIEQFLCATSEKTAVEQEEGMARMVNVMASLTLGRDYLCQDESLLTKLIIPLVMDVYPYKAQTTDITKEHLLVALQKLSLRNNMRLVMIQAGLPEYLVFYLSARHTVMSDYCLEYCLALFMNLCLHAETHMRLKKKSKDVVKFIIDFLSAGHDSCLSYLNSAMYNLFMDPDIRKEAKHEHLDGTITEKSKIVDEETKQQMEVVLDLLNMNRQSTPCGECGCIDQDDEVDHLEAELEFGDKAKGNPNGDDLLRLYQSRTTSRGSNAVPLTCTCRPITPRKKISASEKCPAPLSPLTTAQASAMSVDTEKKPKKHKFCFGICCKKKESKVMEQTSFRDEQNVLASEECPKEASICCGSNVDDECIPTKETTPSKYAQSRVSICSSVFAYDPSEDTRESRGALSQVGSTIVQRSTSRQSVIEEPSKTTTVNEEITETTETMVLDNPSDQAAAFEQSSNILSSSSSRQQSLRGTSLTSSPSKQNTSLASGISRQQSIGSRRLSRTLICSEAEDDACIERCTGKQSFMSKNPSVVSYASRQRASILSKEPSMASRLSMQQRDMIVEEPSLIVNTSRQSIVEEEPSLTSCPSRQASITKSASCGSITPSKEPSLTRSCRNSSVRVSLASMKPSESKQSLQKEPSLMKSLTDDTASTKSPRASHLNLVAPTEDKSVQEPGPDTKKKKRQPCKCCVAKPKKQESTMSANLESEITIEDEDYEPEETCYQSQRIVSEKGVSTVSCTENSTTSRGVFAREPSTYVPPSFTRSVITNPSRQRGNQDAYYWCNQQRQSPCPPCATSGYYGNTKTCATNYAYSNCYREPSQYNYYNKTSTCAYSCPQTQQQKNRYSCDCYNNLKQYAQNTDSCDARSCSTPQQLQNRSNRGYQ